MNLDHYRELLVAKERELIGRRGSLSAVQHDTGDGAAGDIGDESVRDDEKSKAFSTREADDTQLDEVRLALGRIADGTYGLCLVDQEPIPAARLEAVPWARYCAKHQGELESKQNLRTPTA